ncbi:MotA/TolQ/ExbB proton channel family protein [Fundicoccus sp. Sow4_H7]|uniref:MotA/TolQ/ExbB proton channel family protein n=1 Tax=Fundicoccus sp. Sow4_H7 TaxID=3438784 RepID=UPI003F911756
MNLLQPIMDNFFKFDFIIILIAIGTAFLYAKCLNSSKQLLKILEPKANLALGTTTRDQLNHHLDYYLDAKGEHQILDKLKDVNALYIMFNNICAIFPLMGLLGTVISLIPMVGTMETELFFMALTSTFWGIVFAIVFKALNGILQARVEESNQKINTYLLRKDAREARDLSLSDEGGILNV